jgi:hypothetical protein
MVLGAGTIRFTEPKLGIDVTEESAYLTVITDQAVPVRWEDAVEAAIDLDGLEGSPNDGATYGELPQAAGRPKSYEAWRREFTRWLSATERLELLQSPAYRVPSNPGEAERDFRIRLGQLARERRDQWAAELRKKYAPKMAALEERLRRARQGLQTAISLGATLLGAFLGRKAVSATTLGRATTAAKSAGRVLKERQDVSRADETVEALEHALADLEAQFKAETDALEARTDPQTEPLETVSLQPKKTNVAVKLVALVWTPHWQAPDGSVTPAWT